MEKPRPEEEDNFGGSMRVKGEAVRRRWRITMRFRVGDRPAGAVNGVLEVVLRRAGERVEMVGRRIGERVGLTLLNSLGDGGALVRKKFTGFESSEVDE